MSADENKTDSNDENENDIEGGKQCRICYDGDHTESPLISPCLCNGDIKYVHRNCLDEYRIMNEGMVAFTQCNTCQFEYLFEAIGNEKGCKSPKCLLRARVIRDVGLTILLWATLITLIAIFVRTVYHANWGLSFGYGSLGLFAILGIFCLIFGLFYLLAGEPGNVYCWGCYFTPINCGNGGDCGGGNDNCGAVLLVIVIILAIIGLIYASIFTLAVLSTKLAKHYQRYHKSLLSREYIIMNLDGFSNNKIERLQNHQQKNASGLSVIPNPQHINTTSIKSPSKKKGNDLYVLLDPNSVSNEPYPTEHNIIKSDDIESGQTTIKDDIIPTETETVRYE